jgi:hypothetical protein
VAIAIKVFFICSKRYLSIEILIQEIETNKDIIDNRRSERNGDKDVDSRLHSEERERSWAPSPRYPQHGFIILLHKIRTAWSAYISQVFIRLSPFALPILQALAPLSSAPGLIAAGRYRLQAQPRDRGDDRHTRAAGGRAPSTVRPAAWEPGQQQAGVHLVHQLANRAPA